MNRGVEISADVADADRAVITEQVTNGIAVRMACLYLLLAGRTEGSGDVSDHHPARRPGPRPRLRDRRPPRRRRPRRPHRRGRPDVDSHRHRGGRRRRLLGHARLRRPPRPPARTRASRTPRTSRPAPPPAAAGGFTARVPDGQHRPGDRLGRRGRARCGAAGREVGLADVFPVGAITKGLARRASWPSRSSCAARAARVDCFSDDGKPVADSPGDAPRPAVRDARSTRSSATTPRTRT